MCHWAQNDIGRILASCSEEDDVVLEGPLTTDQATYSWPGGWQPTLTRLLGLERLKEEYYTYAVPMGTLQPLWSHDARTWIRLLVGHAWGPKPKLDG